jgi:hypothetical protein
MINFVNYIEFIFKNRGKSEKKWKKSENYIMTTINTSVRLIAEKTRIFGMITANISVCCSCIIK